MKQKIHYHKTILKNGLNLVNISGLSTNSVTLGMYIHAGTRFDPQDKPGLSHFTEHMLFSGTKSFPTPETLSHAIDRYGGWHGAFTWIEHQSHTIQLPEEHFDIGIKVLLETAFHPIIKTSEIEKEKDIIKEEILTNRADPSKAIWDYVWFPLFFQGTSLARPYSGSSEDIDTISEKDVRGFISDYFHPENITLFIAGDLPNGKVEEVVSQYNNPTVKNIVQKKENPLIPIRKNKIFVHKDNSYYQTSLVIGIPTVPFSSSKKYALNILREMLVGYKGSPLLQQLRNEGLIYTFNSFQDNLSDSGYIVITVSSSPEHVTRVAELITQEFNRLSQGNFSEEEVTMAKDHLIGSMVISMQTGVDYINWYYSQELLDPEHVLSPEKAINIYKNIESKEIAELASVYFKKDNILIGAIGKASESSFTGLL